MSINLSNPFCINNDSTQIVTRDITKLITQFTDNLIYNTITPLKFERFPEDIFTLPLVREHHDLYFPILLLAHLNKKIIIDHFHSILNPQMRPLSKTFIQIIFFCLLQMYFLTFSPSLKNITLSVVILSLYPLLSKH